MIEPSPADAGADAEVARRMLDAALEPLREPTDPRAAVIEAYARMEQLLASRELGRRISEAPREYLTRVLRQQGMPERSLASLTEDTLGPTGVAAAGFATAGFAAAGFAAAGLKSLCVNFLMTG